MDKVKQFKYQDEQFTIRQTEDCQFVVTDERGEELTINLEPTGRQVLYRSIAGAKISFQYAVQQAAGYLLELREKPLTPEEACEIASKEFDDLPEQQ